MDAPSELQQVNDWSQPWQGSGSSNRPLPRWDGSPVGLPDSPNPAHSEEDMAVSPQQEALRPRHALLHLPRLLRGLLLLLLLDLEINSPTYIDEVSEAP